MTGPHIHLTADIPADASPEEKTAKRAEAIRSALEIAVADPEFRLRMILGEGYQRFQEVAAWIAGEIEKDEAKAPGTLALAQQFGQFMPLDPKHPRELTEAHQALITAAAEVLKRRALAAEKRLAQIEDKREC